MAIVTLTKREKIGRIEKLTEVRYEIPDSIICPEDKNVMYYSNYHQAYICTNKLCNNEIKGIDFVRQELKNNKVEKIEKDN